MNSKLPESFDTPNFLGSRIYILEYRKNYAKNAIEFQFPHFKPNLTRSDIVSSAPQVVESIQQAPIPEDDLDKRYQAPANIVSDNDHQQYVDNRVLEAQARAALEAA